MALVGVGNCLAPDLLAVELRLLFWNVVEVTVLEHFEEAEWWRKNPKDLAAWETDYQE